MRDIRDFYTVSVENRKSAFKAQILINPFVCRVGRQGHAYGQAAVDPSVLKRSWLALSSTTVFELCLNLRQVDRKRKQLYVI